MTSTIYSNPSFSDTPYGLRLRQTIYSSGPVTIPSNIRRVYAVCIGGGGGGGSAINYSTATITNASGNGSTVTYIANNNFLVGSAVSISGVNPAAYNITYQTIISATPTSFTVSNTAVGLYVSGGTAITSYSTGAGGGGAGGFSTGWTYAANTCVVGAGGIGAVNGVTLSGNGGNTIYGMVMAGGGGNGAVTNATAYGAFPTMGGAFGGQRTDSTATGISTGGTSTSPTSYTGAPGGFVSPGYVGGLAGQQTFNTNGTTTSAYPGVSTCGGSPAAANLATANVTAGAGGLGLICGGGGSAGNYATNPTGTVTGGAGGTGDRFSGGTGSSATMPALTGGAGGGGAGYLGAGGNAVGNFGGNGGMGGGGGGASNNNVRGGDGGQGVIFLYY